MLPQSFPYQTFLTQQKSENHKEKELSLAGINLIVPINRVELEFLG